MEKLKKDFHIDYFLDWNSRVEISKIKEDLEAIEKLGATHIEIDWTEEYDLTFVTIKAKSNRLETDEEYEQRMQEIKKREAQKRKQELKTLRELQEKYQNGSKD